MEYVPRRIEITTPDGESEFISDVEFARIDAPLILLGEPGAGKTSTALAISQIRDTSCDTAYRFASGAHQTEFLSDNPVIDGLDEVQSNSSESIIESILKRLKKCEVRSFVLTCRAADWANVQNERAIENWFSKKPVIGHLQPLDDCEIATMVDAIGTYPSGGEAFLEQANRRSAIDLARNPQSLKMLLAAINEANWPDTKTELFELACVNFAKELNQTHKSLTPNRPSIEQLLFVAGFICAQLLLSGKRGVNVDGQENELFPRPVELASEEINSDHIEMAVSTLLFRPSGIDGVEPTHRTIAEYLGAKWLTEELRSGTLSIRRLETLLYSQGIVPGPLRGLHAWLATLDRDLTNNLVNHDPYGCLRYGDTAQYSIEQARNLICQLQNLSVIDPYFRSEDWEAQIGSGLAREELREELVELIENPCVPYQLSTVILESLTGTELASSIRDTIRCVVLNEEITYITRDRALSALQINNEQEDWQELEEHLLALGSHNSARMAVDIASDHIEIFSGEKIAEIIVNYIRINAEQNIGLAVGTNHRLLAKMSSQQLKQAICILADALPESKDDKEEFERIIEQRLLDALQQYLDGGGNASAENILNWLSKVTHYEYRLNSWNTFSLEYFKSNPELRRNIQALAYEELDESERRILDYHLSGKAIGLRLDESDIIFHLERLFNNRLDINDFISKWSTLAEGVLGNKNLSGAAEQLVRNQAELCTNLQLVVTEIENRPPPQWATDQEQSRLLRAEKKRKETKTRHQSYKDNEDSIRSGQNLHDLYYISSAYLGLIGEFNKIQEPIMRVEMLVGKQSLDAAVKGLQAAIRLNDLPTPREIARKHLEEGKEFYLEKIVLAGCLLEIEIGHEIRDLRRETHLCAFTACHWGSYHSDNSNVQSLEESLIKLLFANIGEMALFIQDTMESAIFAGKNHVSGLYNITSEERFSGLLSSLSIDWLKNSESMSPQVLASLITAALKQADHIALSALIDMKLEAANWPSDEHRRLWYCAAFYADFEYFRAKINIFCHEHPDTLKALSLDTRVSRSEPLSIAQLTFLINTYAPRYPNIEPPSSGWGSDSDYECARFIDGCIAKLGEQLTEEAQRALESIIREDRLGSHRNHALHVLAEHTRTMAEASWAKHTLNDVRQILLGGSPRTVEDLQSAVVDEIEALQRRLKDGIFRGVLPFWNDDRPHIENYCRDRLAEHLEPYLKRFGVRVHTEGTMPDEGRCDLLCTISEIDLPIEVKGQWHPNVWNAACNQLEDNYSRNYRAEGRGIYLVLWFGNVAGHNPPEIRRHGRPNGANEMLDEIYERSPRQISPKTKVFVLDVSK